MTLTEALATSRCRKAIHSLTFPKWVEATDSGFTFWGDGLYQVPWLKIRLIPEAAEVYGSNKWEPIDPKSPLEILTEKF